VVTLLGNGCSIRAVDFPAPEADKGDQVEQVDVRVAALEYENAELRRVLRMMRGMADEALTFPAPRPVPAEALDGPPR
jgi:hypothetical protein